MTITTNLIPVGSGRGICIPDPVIEQLGLSGPIELVVESDGLMIRSHAVRQGWDEHFRRMAENGDDKLLDAPLTATSSWDENEWQW
jgi:antitoxin MazE